MSLTLEQFGIDRLDARQRFELIGLIWDSISDDELYVLPECHLRELEWCITAADADPARDRTMEELLRDCRISHEFADPLS